MLSAYDECTLPLIVYPMENSREAPKKYLGRRAITNLSYASINVFASSNEQMKALHDFWEIDCNYGLDPFVIPLPAFGATSGGVPFTHILARFINDTKDTKNDLTWSAKRNLKILGEVTVITDDAGNIVVSDGEGTLITDNMILSDVIDYTMGEVQEITSYRKVVYGGDDSVKLDYDMETTNIAYDDSRSMDNKALSGQVYDGLMKASNHVKVFNGVQSVPLDIHYDLGEELVTGTNWSNQVGGITIINNGNGTWNVSCDGTGGIDNNGIYLACPCAVLDEVYLSNFTASNISGTVYIKEVYNDRNVGKNIVDGYNEILLLDSGTSIDYSQYYLVIDCSVIWSMDITLPSVKEITTDNSYLTMYNPITKVFDTLGNGTNGGSSIEFNPAGDCSFFVEDLTQTALFLIDNKIKVIDGNGVDNSFISTVQFPTEIGKTYKVEFTGTPISGTGVGLYIDFVAANIGYLWDGEYTWVADRTDTRINIFRYFGHIGQGTIDTISITEVVAVSTIYLQENDFGNAVATNVPLTDAHRDYLKLYPEAIGDLWFEKKTHPLLSITKENIKHWYPANEGVVGTNYIQDITIPLGDELVDQTNTETDWYAEGTNTITTEGSLLKFTYGDTNRMCFTYLDGTGNNIGLLPSGELTGKLLVLTFKAKVDNLSLRATFGNLGNTPQEVEINSTTLEEYVLIFYNESTNSPYLSIDGASIGSNNLWIENGTITMKELSATEIDAYDPTCRTEYLNTTHGLSNLFIEQNGSGRPIGMSGSDIIEFNGDGRYIDTGWIPSVDKDFTIEFILDATNPPTSSQIIGSNIFYFDYRADKNLLFYGYKDRKWVGLGGYLHINHVIGTYNKDTESVDLYLNGIEQLSTSTYTPVIPVNTFILNDNGSLQNNLGYFKVHNSTLTQQEVTTAYNNAKLKYPTLP